MAHYDELQLATRHKIAFHTLVITFLVIMIGGFVKDLYGIWAEPMLEMFVMIFIPGIYFTIMSIAKNAYLRMNDHPRIVIVLMGAATILSGSAVISNMMHGFHTIIEDGQLSDSVGSLLMAIYTGSTTIALIIRRRLNKRTLNKE